jgi:hypothetical protein
MLSQRSCSRSFPYTLTHRPSDVCDGRRLSNVKQGAYELWHGKCLREGKNRGRSLRDFIEIYRKRLRKASEAYDSESYE